MKSSVCKNMPSLTFLRPWMHPAKSLVSWPLSTQSTQAASNAMQNLMKDKQPLVIFFTVNWQTFVIFRFLWGCGLDKLSLNSNKQDKTLVSSLKCENIVKSHLMAFLLLTWPDPCFRPTWPCVPSLWSRRRCWQLGWSRSSVPSGVDGNALSRCREQPQIQLSCHQGKPRNKMSTKKC